MRIHLLILRSVPLARQFLYFALIGVDPLSIQLTAARRLALFEFDHQCGSTLIVKVVSQVHHGIFLAERNVLWIDVRVMETVTRFLWLLLGRAVCVFFHGGSLGLLLLRFLLESEHLIKIILTFGPLRLSLKLSLECLVRSQLPGRVLV